MGTTTQTPEKPKADESKPSPTSRAGRFSVRRAKPRQRLFLLGGVLLLVLIGVLLYLHFAAWESTDDAQIDGYIYPVSARISGYVTRVQVDNNEYVDAGTVLVQLDQEDNKVALANANAALANDRASAAAQQINVPLTSVNTSSQLSSAQADIDNAKAGLLAAEKEFDAARATLQQSEANDLKAQDDVNRYKPLAAKDEIPQQQYTQAVQSQRATAAAVDAARASAASTEQAVTQARARLSQSEANLQFAETKPQQISVQRARAQAADAETDRATAVLHQAKLNLDYTTIVAPVSGIVGQRSVQPGQNVTPGQQLLTIVPLTSDNIWVTANFKETQLKYMRPGQPVKIHVDTYSHTYTGKVLNIAGASGSRFSLLPPENATGNFVKVVQRIPVKIVFDSGQDPNHTLRPGMSVEPDVRVK
jgi:membrane fusion protein, multidrug efflux system